VRSIILFVTVLALPLTAAEELALSPGQTTSWILAIYGLSGAVGLGLAIIYRQPMLMTGNIFALIFIISLGQEFSYAEIIGAFMVTGVAVLLLSLLGLTARLASWLPTPIVFGLLAGAVMPFVARIFTLLGDAPLLVGGTLLAYLFSARFLGARLPPIMSALVAGLALSAVTGQLGAPPGRLPIPLPELTRPVFTIPAMVTIVPVLVILITLQSNSPSIVFMKDQGFKPREKVVDMVSGLGTILGSLLGPVAVSLSLPATSLVAGPEAGERQIRYWTACLAAGGLVAIGLLAGIAAEVPRIIPTSLLLTLAGLAVIGVLTNALQQLTKGPLLLGPVFAFAIALSDISFLGFGPFFWSLVLGTAVSWLLERDEMHALRQAEALDP
jgi:benzoate membrane transport protein